MLLSAQKSFSEDHKLRMIIIDEDTQKMVVNAAIIFIAACKMLEFFNCD